MHRSCQYEWKSHGWSGETPWTHVCFSEAGHESDHFCGLCNETAPQIESDGKAEREMLAMIEEGAFG